VTNLQVRNVRGSFFRSGDRIGFGERCKVASEQPFIVRTVEEQSRKERATTKCLPMLRQLYGKRRNDSKKYQKQREVIALAIRDLTVRMYGIEIDDFRCFVSETVLADYHANGIYPELFASPIRRGRQGKRLRTREIHNGLLEQQADSRANKHAMGIAQNAWRFAHLEGDKLAERVAYHWLYHGTLKPCKDSLCHACNPDRKRRLQARELTMLAFKYLDEHADNATHCGTRKPHKMSKNPPDGFIGAVKQLDSKLYHKAVKKGQLVAV